MYSTSGAQLWIWYFFPRFLLSFFSRFSCFLFIFFFLGCRFVYVWVLVCASRFNGAAGTDGDVFVASLCHSFAKMNEFHRKNDGSVMINKGNEFDDSGNVGSFHHQIIRLDRFRCVRFWQKDMTYGWWKLSEKVLKYYCRELSDLNIECCARMQVLMRYDHRTK